MEKNTRKSGSSNWIYILCAFMLVTVIAVGIISSMGTAKKTDGAVVVPEEETSTEEVTEKTKTKDTTTEASVTEEAETESVAAELTFYMPVTGYISKGYSMSTPVFSLTMNDYRTHSGIDIQAETGAQVSALADGVVTDRYTDPFMGEVVEITHEGGYVSRYMNLSEDCPEGAEVGSSVYGGQAIGCIGESAALEAAEESHLHFEVEKDGEAMNPLELVDYDVVETGYED